LSANVVLAPWPNRTRDGEFTVAGRRHTLEITEPDRDNAIHGFVDDAVWTVTSSGDDTVTLSIDPGVHPGWPWPLHMEVTYRVAVDGLSAEFLLRNDSPERIPAACGFHLYPSALGSPVDECTLAAPAHRVLPLDDRNLPVGQEIDDTPDAGEAAALTDPETPMAGRLLDHCLHVPGAGPVVFTLRDTGGRGVLLETSPELRWFQVFTPDEAWGMPYPGQPGGRAVAVEPMTAPPDALNSGTGLARLPPGGELHCSWTVTAIPPVP
jgi:aldose 1-epimerase